MKESTVARRTLNCRNWILALHLTFVILSSPGAPVFAKSYLKVGLLGEPRGLNPFQVTDAWTTKVIDLIYQPLYLIDPNTSAIIPWLAEDLPVYDDQRKTVTFRLREMNWDDGTEFSADDVAFTAQVIKSFHVPRYHAYWKFVKRIDVLDKRTIQLTVERPMAILSTRTLTTWVVQKRSWEPVVKEAYQRLNLSLDNEKTQGGMEKEATEAALREALQLIQNHIVEEPSGLGPYRFRKWKKGSYLLLERNDHFFGLGKTIAGRKLGPYIDGVMFMIYGSLSEATLALKNAELDFLWKGVSQALVDDLIRDPHIRVPMTLDNGYRYLGFNLRKAPMSDLSFRHAVAYLVDKDFIVKRILHNHGQRLDTFVPPENTFYFNPKTPVYGEGTDRAGRIKEAYRVLTGAGYKWEIPPLESKGSAQQAKGLIMPDGQLVPNMTILSPSADYDTEMATSGQVIVEWLQDLGLSVTWKPMAFGALLQKVRYERDFDMFIMGWRGLSVDPDYLRRFFHSSYDSPNEWNYTGYHNADFDRLAEEQIERVNLQQRRKIVMDLQTQLTKDLPYIPLFVPHRMEGIRTDKFEGWTSISGGVGNIWTFCMLKPIRN